MMKSEAQSSCFRLLSIPNGCLDADEVKVNIDIFQFQERVKIISQFQRFFFAFIRNVNSMQRERALAVPKLSSHGI